MAVEGDKARVTKQQWRTVVISIAAVAFSATAGLEPPLRNLITFARAGASFSAKQLQSCLALKLAPALANVIRLRSGGSRPAVALKATAAMESTTVRHCCLVTLALSPSMAMKKAGVSPLQSWMERWLQYTS